ncbi:MULTISPECIES: bile acid:sodium symporter family protein [Ralstonia]|jgi:solute carrier family 10 (sodium/bile acid cotransporter), member 7|uniref:Bile acid:sodium symporter n=4 Tax=Pseudomonadota TaxID=1224 RepID=A0ABN9HWB6_RALPI|nr:MULTISPECIES: bile acid:sodium symporter family protein [Ralstonia]MBA4014795.1 bile acid:sodium symporter [Ralstonia sp.]MBA4201740.1 bile acid:sodium symporter [Ralstonia sp.]MBA4229655.1 bile acid:sodium symporter [Ralstonia sp.]MBA4236799.1 bile acid:sodium symporter [Ralstonia sp.]MBA4401493.1 bile acid:sodium symporter [Ralstonia sp.]
MKIPLLSPLLSQIDGFIRAMLVMVALALFFPALGASDGPLRLDIVTIVGVSLVFFLHGAALSREKIVEGARNWRLHLFVQSCTFILFPLIGAVILFVCKPFIPAELLLGVFYLCALPSTVSSSVAMTAMAKGNVPAAIFNATISGLIGMIATPLLMSFVIQASGADLSVGKALLGVAEQLLLPFVLGQLLRPVLGGFINKHKAIISKVDRAVILLIVFNSFADSTHAGVWSKYPWETIVAVAVMSSALLFVVLGATTWLSRRAGFSLADEITAVFCGSKKSLANGVPMGKILFAGNSALGLIVLPLMIYHQLQLIVCSTLARRYADRVAHAEARATAPASRVA